MNFYKYRESLIQTRYLLPYNSIILYPQCCAIVTPGFVGLSEIINFQNIFKTGYFLTAALNEQHLGWHFLSLIINLTAPSMIKNNSTELPIGCEHNISP